jgi:hypothetical protein
VDVGRPAWAANGGDADTPPLKFPTPKEALIGFLRSEMIAAARSERHGAAMEPLGRGWGTAEAEKDAAEPKDAFESSSLWSVSGRPERPSAYMPSGVSRSNP